MKKLLLTSLIFTAMLLVMVSSVSAGGYDYCGNGYCGYGENCYSCPQDCGQCATIEITDVQFNGEDSVVVDPSEDVDVEVTVYTTGMGTGNDWKSTKYKIEGGEWICINVPEPDYTYPGTYSETFMITAPASVGVYDFEVKAYNMEDCVDGSSDTYLAEDAIEVVQPVCQVLIDEPFQSILGYEHNGEAYFDSEAVPIEWHLTEACTPVDYFDIWYEKNGDCELDQGSWFDVISHLSTGLAQNPSYPDYHYIWDRPSESGRYCVKIKVSSNGARNVSQKFNVDLAPPVVSLDVGTPNVGDCDVSGEGDCYVNQDTLITITCTDDNPDEPWQSGVDYMEYRYQVNGGEWTNWTEAPDSFTFPEDSNHVLEYRCYDNVGKVDEGSKAFIVDSVGPEFVSKVIGEPQYCEYEGCDMYVTQDTQICVVYNDPLPHPVDDVVVHCETTWWYDNPQGQASGQYELTMDENSCFNFTEDSYHSVYCWAEDALGNVNDSINNIVKEQDIVDSAAPETLFGFEGPYYEECSSTWIDTVSNITLTAEDPEPHPVGLDKTYYRYEKLEDESWCYGTHEGLWQETPKEDESWMEYEEPFGLPESCHVIEYYSTDLLGNEEDVHVEFVFSDHTAPEAVKEVGEPNHNCNGPFGFLQNCEEGWDYIITMQTPVTLSCVDQEPHPSGVEKLCWRMEWDGIDMTNNQCDGTIENGWCCEYTDNPIDIYFNEECEHLLEFYCVDKVNKTSEIDSEIFKVEGNPFPISLDKKWNLISFPFNLLSNNVEEVFSGVEADIEGVWSYEDGTWKVYIPDVTNSLNNVEPGRGYWVKTTEATSFLVGGELFSEGPVLPPAVELDEGWNLIGHYGITPKMAYCSLFSLVDTQEGFPRWSALWGYNSANDQFVPLNSWSYTFPGQGYWLEMDVEDYYTPSTTCWGAPLGP